jgi:hypothetical protein
MHIYIINLGETMSPFWLLRGERNGQTGKQGETVRKITEEVGEGLNTLARTMDHMLKGSFYDSPVYAS